MHETHYKSALLNGIRREWEALMESVGKLTPEQMMTADPGGWSPKDNLSHLAEWLKALTGYHMDHKPAQEVLGIPKELAESFDYTRVNAFMVERNRDRSIQDIMDELKQKYAEVISRLEAMPFDELLQPRFPDDPLKRPLLEWVLGNTIDHFKEHRLNILKVR